MKYLCLLYGNQEKSAKLSKEEFAALVEKCKVHDEELRRTGAVRTLESLEWDVTTIRPSMLESPVLVNLTHLVE